VPVQTGGGVRSLADVEARLQAGAAAVVIGSLLVDDPSAARAIAERFGPRIVAGIDARGERVATRGWQHDGGVLRDDLLRTVAAWPIDRVVYTEISRDGMGSGYDLEALAQVAERTRLRVTASGGARTIDDLIALRDGTPPNVDRAIVGRAVYDGTITLAALAENGFSRRA
jgi:phosphoribosylformimino-5-aminoimidazole carboxamide ribotide isomerase